MGRSRTSTDDCVTYRQQRSKMALVALLGLGFVALGMSFALEPAFWQTSRYSASTIRIVGWCIGVFFLLALVSSVVAIAKPASVRLSPEGLVVKYAWWTYSRPWKAVSNFRVWKYRGVSSVVYDDEMASKAWYAPINRSINGATSALPKYLNVEPEQLLDAVNAAKDRWA